MRKIFVCLFSVFVIVNALPQFRYQDTGEVRLRRSSPRSAVMFGRYYGRPIKRNSEYIPAPRNAMSAFVVGDTAGTSSYVGEVGAYDSNLNTVEAADSFETEQTEKVVQNNVYKAPSEDFTTLSPPIEITEVVAEEVVHPESTTTREAVKRRPSSSKPSSSVTTDSKKEEEDDDEDQSGFWPFKVNNRGQPVYNAFFPITLGGLGGRSRVKAYDGIEELPSPGAATAIANSFSTGKGGVATSHATSYGDPYLSTLLRSGFSFNKNKNLQGV